MSNHHERENSLCPLCEEKLTEGHPVIQKWFKAIKAFNKEVHTSWVYRGEADQNQFYKNRESRVLYPNSKHNATLDGEPCSRAMDLIFIRPDGVLYPDSLQIAKLRDVNSFLQAQSAPLVWGGSWEKFKDYDHFQLADSVKQTDDK